MSELQVSARLSIHDGKLDEFKAVAARCVESVRTKDTGTLQYDWFLSPDGRECVVRETYRDSGALLEHIGNLGDTLDELFGLCDMDIEMYGSPSQELMDATSDTGARTYTPLQSI